MVSQKVAANGVELLHVRRDMDHVHCIQLHVTRRCQQLLLPLDADDAGAPGEG